MQEERKRHCAGLCQVKLLSFFQTISLRRTHKEHWKRKVQGCNLGIINWIELKKFSHIFEKGNKTFPI